MSRPQNLRESPLVRRARELLAIPGNSSVDEIKKAFHKMAFLYHPDRNTRINASEQFDRVRQAYALLLDPSQIHSLNIEYTQSRLRQTFVDGLTVNFGAFFGLRTFEPEKKIERRFRIGTENMGESDDDGLAAMISEEDHSILDSSAYDAIEVVYAGQLSAEDDSGLMESTTSQQLGLLPWVLLNNEGLLSVSDGNVKRALKSYEELNERVPKNIIFLYRLALCEIIQAFENPQRNLMGLKKPDPVLITKAVNRLRSCIHIGDTRQIGRQKCLVIRKVLAEVLAKTGKRRQAQKVWRDIQNLKPGSIEAAFYLQGRKQALALMERRPLRANPGQKSPPSKLKQLATRKN
mgnify:CR=1 FL=1